MLCISTNGTPLSKKIISSLKLLKNLRTLQISIDGLKKTHDAIRGVKESFDKAITAVKISKKKLKNTKLTIISPLMEENKSEIIKILELVNRLKVNTWGLVTLYPVKKSKEAEDIDFFQKYQLFQKIAKFYKNKKPKLKNRIAYFSSSNSQSFKRN